MKSVTKQKKRGRDHTFGNWKNLDVASIEALLGEGSLKSRDVEIYKGYGEKLSTWIISLDEAKIVSNLIESQASYRRSATSAKASNDCGYSKEYLEGKKGRQL